MTNESKLLTLLLALFLASFLAPRSAAAQEADSAAALEAPASAASAASAPSAPDYRLDVTVPSAGIGWFSAPAGHYDATIFTLSGDVRIVERHGHGAMLRVAHGTNIWGGGTAVELDYVYRLRLAGDDRFGLGLDTTVGMTIASLSHNEATIPDGLAVGGNTGLSLDFRAYGFVVSLGGQYRLLLPQEAALNGGASGPEHALTVTLGLGFGFWG
jgi:hypothetical protein